MIKGRISRCFWSSLPFSRRPGWRQVPEPSFGIVAAQTLQSFCCSASLAFLTGIQLMLRVWRPMLNDDRGDFCRLPSARYERLQRGPRLISGSAQVTHHVVGQLDFSALASTAVTVPVTLMPSVAFHRGEQVWASVRSCFDVPSETRSRSDVDGPVPRLSTSWLLSLCSCDERRSHPGSFRKTGRTGEQNQTDAGSQTHEHAGKSVTDLTWLLDLVATLREADPIGRLRIAHAAQGDRRLSRR